MSKSKRRYSDDDDEAGAERDKRKAAKKVEKVAKLLGYTNDTNPFGDSNLTQPFVWGKKTEREKKEKKRDKTDSSSDKRLDLMEEINRVRKRREDREAEQEEMERLRNEEQRLREAAQYGNWQEKEEEFHLKQTQVRSKIRLADSREQPIDLLAKNILLIEAAANKSSSRRPDSLDLDIVNIDVELRDPVSLIESLNVDEVEGLVEGIESYCQNSVNERDSYESFWQSLKLIVSTTIRRLRRRESAAIHKSLVTEVEQLLDGKSERELDAMQADITLGIRVGRYADVGYWEQISEEIDFQRAKANVTKTHKALLRKQLQILDALKREIRASKSTRDEVDEGESKQVSRDGGMEEAEDAMMMSERKKGLSEDEERMQSNEEICLPGETYWWQDRHRPRKPRYFNRVRTGWDWNKYNQTHYDHDNPPPKTVHGYKFAIFYPDLIDKTVSPQYFLEAAEEKEFAIIRFHAGPPYEDIAFKVVNRQWDIHRKSGFKCVFERGLLQLHFNFKGHWYRR